MESTPKRTWSQARFGALASDLAIVVRQALQLAHELALKAHLSGEMDHNDTYGHTLKVKMNQVLAEKLQKLPGVTLRKPAGGRFHLPIVDETSTALLPIRYSTDRRVTRDDAKIDLSAYRRSLLSLVSANPDKGQQLSIEDALSGDIDVDAHYQQMRDLDQQLAAFGQVATIGFASNPTSGLWGLGWGDLRVDEDNDTAVWESWEALPEIHAGLEPSLQRPTFRSVPALDAVYFDQTDEADDLGLLPRTGAGSAEGHAQPDLKGDVSNP